MSPGEFTDAGSIEVFLNPQTLAEAAAEQFARFAWEAILRRGRFIVALSGGSTPRPTYARLASADFSDKVDWFKVHVFWSDERAVPLDHPQSNYRMAREALLAHIPVPDGNVHPIRGDLDPRLAANRYEHEIASLFGSVEPTPRFDLILLGLGSDGHTASLFPHTAALNERERVVVANRVPQLSTWRITFTAPLINAAHNVTFLVTGEEKAEVLALVLKGERQPEDYPAQLVDPASGRLTWLVDEAAASKPEQR